MARSFWGKIYFNDVYVGRLQEEPGGRCIFAYDPSYLESGQPAIAYTLPLRTAPYLSERGLHPFFDNLVDDATLAALLGRASLSGVQRKLLVIKEGKHYRPVGPAELSTHIAKLSSGNLANLIELEYLTTLAIQKLLPDDDVVSVEITTLSAIHESALIVPRFDRTPSGKRRHFEEFNQLFGNYPDDKYEGSYEAMGEFIRATPGCIPAEADRLFRRILTYLLVGNTDAHLKNFAMFHARDGLRLTPAYDAVAATVYPQYKSIALKLSGTANLQIGSLKPAHIFRMAKGFGLDQDAVQIAVEEMAKRLPAALGIVSESGIDPESLRDQLIEIMEKRWNGTFTLIGRQSSKKPSSGAKHKS